MLEESIRITIRNNQTIYLYVSVSESFFFGQDMFISKYCLSSGIIQWVCLSVPEIYSVVSCFRTKIFETSHFFSVSTTRSPFAVNRGPCLQAESTNLFLPQPFQNGFQNGGSHLSASSSFHAPRSYDSSVRSRISEKFQYEESDHSDNSETKSEVSRQTSICPVDSTTKQSAGFSFSKLICMYMCMQKVNGTSKQIFISVNRETEKFKERGDWPQLVDNNVSFIWK